MKKIILTEQGLGVTYQTSPDKIYEGYVATSNDALSFKNDRDIYQTVGTNGYLEIPEGYLVVKATYGKHDMDCYTWDKGVYLIVQQSPYCDSQYTAKDEEWPCLIKDHSTVIADPWGVLGEPEETQEVSQRTVEVYQYVLLQEPQGEWKVGDLAEVESVNINGSYMLKDYSKPVGAIVRPDQCVPAAAAGTKRVPCRSTSFKSPVVQCPDYNSEGVKQVPALIKPDVMTSENKGIIKKQKAIGAELLKKLRVIHPAAILAGGAPRNWFFNRPANDLDFFVRVPEGNVSCTHLMDSLGILGVTDMFNMATHKAPGVQRETSGTSSDHTYDERMSDIHTVIEGRYEGQTVQVIFTKVETFGYIEEHFDTSINMIWCDLNHYDSQLIIRKTREWDATESTGVIFVFDNQNAYHNNHLEKVAGYFPDAPMAHYRHIGAIRKDPSLASKFCQPWDVILQELMNDQNENEREFEQFF